MTTSNISEALHRLRTFVIDDALPLWCTSGFDAGAGSFLERLSLNGEPQIEAPRRAIVQARQIYVYAHASLLGCSPLGKTDILNAAHQLIANYQGVDGRPGWVFSICRDRRVFDGRRDFYTHAFALFGLAWAYKLSPDSAFLKSAYATLDILDREFRAPRGGYIGCASSEPLRVLGQNPHMHLLEAMLAWHEATGEAGFLARAGELYSMMATRFFRPDRNILPEYFDPSWGPIDGPQVCEPGHHYEWSWLLRDYAKRLKRVDEPIASALKAFADDHGFNANGLIVDEVLDDGSVYTASTRSWPHTEAIKAEVAAFDAGDMLAPARAARVIDRLCDVFLGKPIAGGWLDHLNEDGSLRSEFIPASTLYHVFLGMAEANRVWGCP